MPSSNPLPPKENALFKRILKCYEHKQYKMGLKFAKQILSTPGFSQHGETLAMKGLTLNCLGRKEEAYEHVRRGLRNDLRSHVCWHVYGLLQRSDKKYDEAIKCYRNALKWEKDNLQILRDLAFLQIHMRDLEGYRDTRFNLLTLRPTQRASWICFAMANHLLKDYKSALETLDTFNSTMLTKVIDYDHSELLLYHNMILQESGNLNEALNHLEANREQIFDKLSVDEQLANLYLSLECYSNAEVRIRQLIQRNPENSSYYTMLQKAKNFVSDDAKVMLLREMISEYPRALTPKRLILNHTHGDEFRIEVNRFLTNGFRKGVPPMFVDLRSLYKDESKVAIIQELLDKYVSSLAERKTFSEEDTSEEPASAILWVYYYLAQHHDFLGDTEKALHFVNLAIDHTPTLIELFLTKAKIYKHAGDFYEAYKWVDEAQALDTADRYINSKCAKYMLRANMVKEAEEMCSKFTREGVSAMENLNEMQCMWFQTECALAFKRLEIWGEALKKCHEVDRHFSEIIDDQFDFHTYCIRKMTLRSYVGLLRLEDVLRSHSFYHKAASCAISVYLHLYDKPLKDEKLEEDQNIENLAPSELKKLRNKQRKARRKAELQQAEATAAAEKKEMEHKSRQPGADADFDSPPQEELVAEKLARVSDPLDQAIKFLIPLQLLCPNQADTHVMAYELYSRKAKPLLMLQSVKRAVGVDKTLPLVHSILVRFVREVEIWKSKGNLDPIITSVISHQMEPITLGKSAQELNSIYLQQHGHSLPAAHQAGKLIYLLDPSKQAEAIKLATNLNLKDAVLKNAFAILESMKNGEFGPCESALLDFKSRCHAKFPLAEAFRPPGYVIEPPPPAAVTPIQEFSCDIYVN